MHSPLQLAGLILAAGNSTRMGTDKAMLPWPPSPTGAADPPRPTLLSAALAAFAPLTFFNVVVAGRNAEAIAGTASACGAHLVRNPNPENGQFSSLRIGLRALLDHGAGAAMITPVDCPPLSAPSLELLRNAFLKSLAAGAWAVAPEHNGKHGHPLLAGRALIDAFLDAPITSNAREVLHTHASHVVYVPVPEPLAKAGLNTPEDYADVAG
jgi:molybdenum cofactor cytidylyltransferase